MTSRFRDSLQIFRCVAYYPAIAQVVGIKESILLCQLEFWLGKGTSERGDGWIYKSAEDIEVETGLTYREQKRARESLVKLKLVEEDYQRDEHRLYFRVVEDELQKLGEQLDKKHMTKRQVPADLPLGGIRRNVDSYKEQEKTQEKTHITSGDLAGRIEEIYKTYPKHKAKGAAEKAIEKAIRRVMAGEGMGIKVPLDDAAMFLFEKAQRYRREREGEDDKFTPYPATWFNAKSYLDASSKPVGSLSLLETQSTNKNAIELTRAQLGGGRR